MLARYRNDGLSAKFDFSDSTLTLEDMKKVFLRNFRKVIYLFVDFDEVLENEEGNHFITVMVAKPVPGDVVIDSLEFENDLKEFKNLMNFGNVRFSIEVTLKPYDGNSMSFVYKINNESRTKRYAYAGYSLDSSFSECVF